MLLFGGKADGNVLRAGVERARHWIAFFVQKQIVASSISPLVMIDLAGRLTYANPAALKAWGYESESEVLNRPVVDFCADSGQLTAYLGKIRTNRRKCQRTRCQA